MKRSLFCVSMCLICLLAAMAAPAMADQTASGQKSDYEITYWESVKDSDNIEMYRAYLKHYPDGIFADLAKIKIKGLEQKLPAAEISTAKPAVQVTSVHLRDTPEKLDEKAVKAMLRQHNFCDLKRNQAGDFKNAFIDNQDGTITDTATGLIWEKVGSWHKLTRLRARKYIEDLNWKKLAGRSDWRLPTLEELASLIESNYSERDWLYINPIFGDSNGDWVNRVWTSDTQDPIYKAKHGGWVVSFKHGTIMSAYWGDIDSVATFPYDSNNVRAVCSKK